MSELVYTAYQLHEIAAHSGGYGQLLHGAVMGSLFVDKGVDLAIDKWREHKAGGNLNNLQDHYAGQKQHLLDMTQNNEVFISAPAEIKLMQLADTVAQQMRDTETKLAAMKAEDAKAHALILEDRLKLEAQQKDDYQKLAEVAKQEALREEQLKDELQTRATEMIKEQQKQQEDMTKSLETRGFDQNEIRDKQEAQQKIFEEQQRQVKQEAWQKHQEEMRQAYEKAMLVQSHSQRADSMFQR